MQNLDQQQGRAVVETGGGVGRERRGHDDDPGERQKRHDRRMTKAGEQEQRNQPGRRDPGQAGDREIGSENIPYAEIDGIDQHGRLQRQRQRLAEDEADGAPGRDPRGAALDPRACRAEPRRKRLRQQGDEQHAAQRHGLRDDRQAVQNDRQIAKQIHKECHCQGPVAVNGTSPRVMCPSTASTCQRTT